jgi:hypothetical protein
MEELIQEFINEESNELKQQLEDKNKILEDTQKILEVKNKEIKVLPQIEKQKILLKQFALSGSLVYICKVKTYENGSYIIKVGESRLGVEARFKEHKYKYEEILLLDCFAVNKSKDFESFLHDQIKKHRVLDLEGHENERELFLIGKELSYSQLLKIIDNNIKNYNEINNNKEIEKLKNKNLKLESENIKNINNIENKDFMEFLQSNKILIDKVNKLELIIENLKNEVLSKLNNMQSNTTTGFNTTLPTIGPRLQKINPDTLQLIKYYEKVSDCLQEDIKIKRPSLQKAIDNCTIYQNFRWQLVPRNLDATIPFDIKPTKEFKHSNPDYIAKLNIEKNEIINVYLNRKSAAKHNNYKLSFDSFQNIIKNNKLFENHYYTLYEDCDEELKQEFIKKNNDIKPFLYVNGFGQYDLNNNLVQEFLSKFDCVKILHISDKTLNKCLENKSPYNGFYYKVLGEKSKCL